MLNDSCLFNTQNLNIINSRTKTSRKAANGYVIRFKLIIASFNHLINSYTSMPISYSAAVRGTIENMMQIRVQI